MPFVVAFDCLDTCALLGVTDDAGRLFLVLKSIVDCFAKLVNVVAVDDDGMEAEIPTYP